MSIPVIMNDEVEQAKHNAILIGNYINYKNIYCNKIFDEQRLLYVQKAKCIYSKYILLENI